jgi:hypothetical protein
MALSSAARVSFRAVQTVLQDSQAEFTARFVPVIQHLNVLTDGDGTGEADWLYAAERTVASDTDDDIDLVSSLTDVYGNLLLTARLITLVVINQRADGTANTTNLTVGDADSASVPLFGAGTTRAFQPIRPGGSLWLHSPGVNGICAMTATFADTLKITNSAGAENRYQLLVIARTTIV